MAEHLARVWATQSVSRNVAAAAVLTSDGHAGHSCRLTGPEAITYGDVADVLSALTGSPVEYVDVPEKRARKGLIASGMPEWLVRHLVGAFRMIRADDFADVTGTVEELTGRPPRRFAEFARDHRAVFVRGSDPAGNSSPPSTGRVAPVVSPGAFGVAIDRGLYAQAWPDIESGQSTM